MKRGLKKEIQFNQDYRQQDTSTDTSIGRERLKINSRLYPLSSRHADKIKERPKANEESLYREDSYFKISNYLDLDFLTEIRKDVLFGLSLPQKSIPSKYFYDDIGSQLFERICGLPEYYPTRTEISILESYAPSIMSFFADEKADLVELGCGSDIKIRKLLNGSGKIHNTRYIPVDISANCLKTAAQRLRRDYRQLQVYGIIADFTRHLKFLPSNRKMIVFLGGTFGNFSNSEGIRLLQSFAEAMNSGDRLLIGIDMLKPLPVLEAAYNDNDGVTARFNLNILNHLNHRLGANFNIDNFEHRAFFNGEMERIEMHLEAKRDMEIRISDLNMVVRIKKGETIHTENSHKYSHRSATEQFIKAGLEPLAWHTDEKNWFSLVELGTYRR